MRTAEVTVVVIQKRQHLSIAAFNCHTAVGNKLKGVYLTVAGAHPIIIVVLRHSEHVVVASSLTVAVILAGDIGLIEHGDILVNSLLRIGSAEYLYLRRLIREGQDKLCAVLRVICLLLHVLDGYDDLPVLHVGRRLRRGLGSRRRLRGHGRQRRQLNIAQIAAGAQAEGQRKRKYYRNCFFHGRTILSAVMTRLR